MIKSDGGREEVTSYSDFDIQRRWKKLKEKKKKKLKLKEKMKIVECVCHIRNELL